MGRRSSTGASTAVVLAVLALVLIGAHFQEARAQDDEPEYEEYDPTERDDLRSLAEILRRLAAQRLASLRSPSNGGEPDEETNGDSGEAANGDGDAEESSGGGGGRRSGPSVFSFPFGTSAGFAAIPGFGSPGGPIAGLPVPGGGGFPSGFGGFPVAAGSAGVLGGIPSIAVVGSGLLVGRARCSDDVVSVQSECAVSGFSAPCCDALEEAVSNGCWCPFGGAAGGAALPGAAAGSGAFPFGGILEVSDEAKQAVYDDLEEQCGRSFEWPDDEDC